jgi:hypothetical protein
MQFLHIIGGREGVVDRDLGAFPPDLEPIVRRLIARDCKLPEAEDVSSRLRGREVTFYKNVWLGQIELAEGDRYYFLTRPSGRKGRLIPISNAIGAVDRANRQYALNLTRENIADYLNFYYAFTPKEDPMLSRMPGGGGPSQLAVPRSIDDLEIEDSDRAAAASEKSGCSDECLVSGAVWHFLDGDSHHRVVPLRYRRRINVSGRIPVQFRHAVFAVDFRVPQDTGVPILSHEELLFQSNALREPTFPRSRLLEHSETHQAFRALAKSARLVELAHDQDWAGCIGRGVDPLRPRHALLLGLRGVVLGREWLDWQGPQNQFQLWTPHLGQPDWTLVAYWWTCAAILTFLWGIVLTTHRDKIFNWVFRLCPRKIQPWVVGGLDHFVTRWDDVMTAQHTFGKRAWWSVIHLAIWGAYLIAAFTSLQILSDLAEGPLLIAGMLVVQALMNLPFIAFALIQALKVLDWVNPVAEGILDAPVLWAFQIAMGFVVFKGLYRVWSYTVETSPYTFFRRMRAQSTKKRKGGAADGNS